MDEATENRFMPEMQKIRQNGGRQLMTNLEYQANITDLLAAQSNTSTKSRRQYYLAER